MFINPCFQYRAPTLSFNAVFDFPRGTHIDDNYVDFAFLREKYCINEARSRMLQILVDYHNKNKKRILQAGFEILEDSLVNELSIKPCDAPVRFGYLQAANTEFYRGYRYIKFRKIL